MLALATAVAAARACPSFRAEQLVASVALLDRSDCQQSLKQHTAQMPAGWLPHVASNSTGSCHMVWLALYVLYYTTSYDELAGRG